MSLDEPRKKLNKIDEEIVRLLEERVVICKEIGKIKAAQKIEVMDMSREREVLDRVTSSVAVAPPEGVRSIFKEIISMCRGVQKGTTVAYLGPAGSFSHEAALSTFGASTKMLPCRRVKKIFVEVESGRADVGVVPLENSIEGGVNETLDCFVDHPVFIVGEVRLRICQNLIVNPQVQSLGEIERVYTHPQALGQCDGYISKYLSEKEIVVTESTARAVEHVLRDSKGAAIGSSAAAELNGLKVYETSIEDTSSNYTRFVVIRREPLPKGGTKTSVIFALEHIPGSLAKVLDEFAKHGLNITMVLSRPIPQRSWEYFFYLDFEGKVTDEAVESALREIRGKTRFLRVMGSYSLLQ